MSGTLEGRCAVITGGSMGLGYAIAECFLRESADVLICSRTSAELEDARSKFSLKFPDRHVAAIVADVSEIEDVNHVFDEARRVFGSYQIVVNNAGIHGPIGPLIDCDLGAWVKAIGVNLIGTAQVCHQALQDFRSAAYGKIINLSGGGATAPQFGLSAYAASKAGLVRLTETLALEARSLGVDVNAVAPGALATRLTAELAHSGEDGIGSEAHARVIAMRERGGSSLQKAAELCVYLASSASDGCSGRLISAVWDPWPFSPERIKEMMESDIYTLRRIVPEDRGQNW